MSAPDVEALLREHRYREVRGDYEVAPHYKHFGCSCGWQQDIAGMSGWRSWLAAHDAHVAAIITAAYAETLAGVRAEVQGEAEERLDAVFTHYDLSPALYPTTPDLDHPAHIASKGALRASHLLRERCEAALRTLGADRIEGA